MKRARDVRDQLVGLMERVELEMESHSEDHDGIKKAITAGFFYNAAQLQKSGNYRTVKNPQAVHLHPSSGLAEVPHSPSLVMHAAIATDGRACSPFLIAVRREVML